VVGLGFVIELAALGGRAKLNGGRAKLNGGGTQLNGGGTQLGERDIMALLSV
jgi:hypothetical protein